MAKIALELDKLTSFNFGWGVLRWVAWTIWSDACLLDQITYIIFNNTWNKNFVMHKSLLSKVYFLCDMNKKFVKTESKNSQYWIDYHLELRFCFSPKEMMAVGPMLTVKLQDLENLLKILPEDSVVWIHWKVRFFLFRAIFYFNFTSLFFYFLKFWNFRNFRSILVIQWWRKSYTNNQ